LDVPNAALIEPSEDLASPVPGQAETPDEFFHPPAAEGQKIGDGRRYRNRKLI
jgi:hypothetical protein